MALQVGIAVLSTAVFAVVLFSFLKWLKDLILSSFLKWLKDLIKNSEVLDLQKVREERRPPSVNRKTTSLIDESEGFYGRDADKKAIIDMLISGDDNGSNPGVIPIVGMGGVGKTTLAQHVYNDKAVEEQFKIRVWVCVSVQFDETKVTQEIVKKVTGTACPYDDLDQLQGELKKALNGKKFLLVLDDVWSEDYEEWRRLLTPLRSGAAGSKLIITTRSKEVASKVQTVPTHDLRVLEDEDCWKLFARHACLDVNSTANHPELQEIGKKIVRKCGGLPLAAKALGGVLRWQTKAEKWKRVLRSEFWEVRNANILPALAMSYIHLPSHLKRCFAYCAIFPQDYKFKKEELVALWTSEGFLLQKKKGNESLEEIGEMYFDDLVSRSFFQEMNNCFVMHDLVHDLARFVSGEFCFRLEGEILWKMGERTRHLSSEGNRKNVGEEFQSIRETPFLRSFVLANERGLFCSCWSTGKCVNKEVIDGLLPTWKLLRVLSLTCPGIRELPNSIDNLKHMRHLNLSATSIRLLPEAVTALFNLEVLILKGCRELVELPADMARLINLCLLDLRRTPKLKGMPPEMGKLKKLSKLSDFVVGEDGGSSIKELGHLRYLGGRISIRRLQNVEDDGDASEVILKDKENLKVLELRWEGNANSSRQAEEVLERLKPHTQIECIEIQNYGGAEFPNWVGDISFSKLKELRLIECQKFICSPPFGQLASLEELSIICGYNLVYNGVLEAIGPEFYGKCKPGEKPFSSLKRLTFISMKNWREWSSCDGAFPVLEELELCYCPKLMSVSHHLPSLKRLQIRDCKEVNCISLDTFPNLEYLYIIDCWNLKSLVRSTTTRTSDPLVLLSLTSLDIEKCYQLVYFSSGGLRAPNLKSMKIEWCSNLESLLPGIHSLLSSLENLELYMCCKLLSVPSHLPSLKRLQIVGCHKVKCISVETFPNLKKLSILDCSNLESLINSEKVKSISVETFPNLEELVIWKCSNLECLVGSTATRRTSDPLGLFTPSLISLTIGECSKLVCFPGRGLDAPNLKRMRIFECGNLKSLPQGVHSLLSSLEELEFCDCPGLLSVPSHLPSLKRLRIERCGELDIENLLICATILETIHIQGNRKMKCISAKTFPNLQKVYISGCSNWREWDSCDGAFPILENLELCNCPKLMSVPSHLPSLKRLWIEDCGEQCISIETSPNLERLDIGYCPNLESLVGPTAAAATTTRTSDPLFFPSLIELAIYGCSNLVSFPRGGLHASNLRRLTIESCGNLKSLPQGMHSLLPSLEWLFIYNCPQIESLPEEGLPFSLNFLRIGGCPLLEKRCKLGEGEDWPKIKHIPNFYIGT